MSVGLIKLDYRTSHMKTISTSRHSAKVEDDIVLEKGLTTRRVCRPTIVDNQESPENTVKIDIIHQRKSKKNEWEDTEKINLNKLKADEGVHLALSSSETKALFECLCLLYKIGEKGVLWGSVSHSFIPNDIKPLVESLLQQGLTKEVWEELASQKPDIASRLAMSQIQQDRTIALKEFEENIDTDKPESYWQDFFNKNEWIFGYGLKYHFLKTVENQPTYGGANLSGRGNQRGDSLNASEGELKFTVLVEIKRPNTPLVAANIYRNGVATLHTELIGGTSQVHINVQKWSLTSKNPDNISLQYEHKIYTHEPRGVLVIGRLGQLTEIEHRETFESYRRNMRNPEIITFDELLERARFIVSPNKKSKENNGNTYATPVQPIDTSNNDDLPS